MSTTTAIKLFVLLLISKSLLSIVSGKSLIAKFDRNNLKINIEFQLNNKETVLLSDFDKQLFPKAQNITKLKVFKQIPTATVKECKNSGTNTLDIDFTVSTNRTLSENYVNGNNSLLGQTVILYDKNGQKLGCSVLVGSNDESSYATAIISNKEVGGKIEFIQNQYNDVALFGQFKFYMTTSSPVEFYISDSSVTSNNGSCGKDLEKKLELGNNKRVVEGSLDGNKQINSIIYVNLNLSEVTSKAFVIRTNSSIIGCANIKLSGPLKAQSEFNSSRDKGISGNFQFTQISPYHDTKIEASLSGLERAVKGYHIHEYPISNFFHTSRCSPQSVAGHLNPDKVDQKTSPEPMKGTTDMYEVGDLSGKYGFLTNLTQFSLTKYDRGVTLYGPTSILGRSLVIHKNDAQASRYVCANIEPANSRMLSATANFGKDTILSGYVEMNQWKLPNGILTPTVMILKLTHRRPGLQTKNHNWHIHQRRIDPKTDKGTCMSVKGHYNPLKINIKDVNYKAYCSPEHPYSCEIGDTSKKTNAYDIDGKKKFFVDEMSPLFGNFTEIGRSVTIHAKNFGAPRISCADFLPSKSNTSSSSDIIYFESNLKDKSYMNEEGDLAIMLCEYLGIPSSSSWQMNSVKTEPSVVNDDCFKLSFYVLGEASVNHVYREKMEQLKRGQKKLNGIIESCDSSTGIGIALHPSAVVMLFSLVIIYYS